MCANLICTHNSIVKVKGWEKILFYTQVNGKYKALNSIISIIFFLNWEVGRVRENFIYKDSCFKKQQYKLIVCKHIVIIQ